jgi:zinc and cadmium transporter
MTLLLLALLFGVIAVLAVVIRAAIVIRVMNLWSSVIPTLLGFASGRLLAAAFLGLIPEAATSLDLPDVTSLVLVAVIVFFLLEKWALWRHCHDPNCPVHSTAGYLVAQVEGLDGFSVRGALVTIVRLRPIEPKTWYLPSCRITIQEAAWL